MRHVLRTERALTTLATLVAASSLAMSVLAAASTLGCSGDGADESDDSVAGGVKGGCGKKKNCGGASSSSSSSASGAGGSTSTSSGSSSSSASSGSGGAPSCALTDSGPVQATADGQVFEKLRITSTSGPAVSIDGHSGVIIRDCEILHQGGAGIEFFGAPGLTIERTRVVHTGAPSNGANPSDELVNIVGYGSPNIVVSNVRLERGSSGIYLIESPGAHLSFIEGHDFRGPFPRGQLVQFDKSSDGTLEDFSCLTPPDTSWPEDNVSVYQSSNVVVRRGLIVGNNSPSGVGVMFEQSDGVTSGGLCEDVDTDDMGNGSFSGYPAREVTFNRTRARNNHCGGQAGRQAPLSNSLVWAGSPQSDSLAVHDSSYFDLCNPGNVIWSTDVFVAPIELTEEDFALRAPIQVDFCWD